MNLPLRCLLVEDSHDDAQLMLHRLRSGGFEVSAERVDRAETLQAALDRQSWDLVIADYRMPGFSGMSALAMVRARDDDLPFILLSGEVSEELAVEAMRAGANDYLSKDQIQRLAPAVQRELQEAAARRAHRKTAAALQTREAQLRFVADHMPTLVAHCDHECRYKFVNQPYAELYGRRPADLVGRPMREVVGDADYAEADPRLVMVLSGQRVEHDVETRKPAGSPRSLHACYVPEFAVDGEVVGFVVALVDITARKRLEAADAFLARAGIEPDGEPFFAALARFLATSLNVEYVCIDRLDEPSTASTVVVWRDGELQQNRRYALSGTPCGQVVLQNFCCHAANVRSVFPTAKVLRELRAESYVGIALQSHNGRAIGLIAAISSRPQESPSEAEALLVRVAPRAAAELERLSMTTALRESEARFRSLFEQAPLGAAVVDSRSGAILEVNELFANIAGHAVPDLNRMDWLQMIHPDDLAAGLAQRERMWCGKIASFELDQRLRQPDGSYKWIHVTVARILRGAEGDTRQLCMIQDISERKAADDALRANHAVLRQFNALAVGRELRMVELKLEVNQLCARLGEPPRHRVVATLPNRGDET